MSEFDSKDEFLKAKDLIQQQRYDEARDILKSLSHPTAAKWLEKLDEIAPERKRKDPELADLLVSDPDKPKGLPTILETEQDQLQRARSLIQQKRYDDARVILEMLDNPTADRWLRKLDEIDTFGPSPSSEQPVTQVIVNTDSGGPGCLVQGLWFLFIGWWLGALWINLSWFLMLTVIGLPLAIFMINRISQIIALRSPRSSNQVVVTTQGGNTRVEIGGRKPQINLLVRIVYFVLVGWWLSFIWMNLAYFFCAIIIGLPLGFWMFDRTPGVLTLKRV